MRIISKFHDYYDCIQREGQDQSLIYLRKAEDEVPGWYGPILNHARYTQPSTGLSFDQFMIGFCGKIYPLVTCKKTDEDPIFCYSVEAVDKWIEENCDKHQKLKYNAKGYVRRGIGLRNKEVRKFFLEGEQNRDFYQKKFEQKLSPIFVCRSSSNYRRYIQWNACLKDYQFYQVFDTYTAYQEISMFLGSLAMPEKPIPVLPDKTMAEIKGFNKWSFRKEPTKKK